MAGFFNLTPRSSKENDKKLANKLKTSKSSTGISVKGGGNGIQERISLINATVDKVFPNIFLEK